MIGNSGIPFAQRKIEPIGWERTVTAGIAALRANTIGVIVADSLETRLRRAGDA